MEYVSAAAVFTGGNGLSVAGAPITGSASLALSPGVTVASGAIVQHATGVLASSIQNMIGGNNGEASKNGNGGKQTIKNNLGKEIDVTPSKKHSKVSKNPRPFGEPNSSVNILNSKGEVITRRFYDKSGTAVRDVDMTNHGNPKNHPEYPHEHKWKYDSNGKPTRE